MLIIVWLFLTLIHLKPCIGIGSDVKSISVYAQTSGASSAQLKVTLDWNSTQYSCIWFTAEIYTNYSCNSTAKAWKPTTITPNKAIPYQIKIELIPERVPGWNPPTQKKIVIEMINVTDTTGSYYAINRFCIRLVLKYMILIIYFQMQKTT